MIATLDQDTIAAIAIVMESDVTTRTIEIHADTEDGVGSQVYREEISADGTVGPFTEMNDGDAVWRKRSRSPTCPCGPLGELIGRSWTATEIDRGVGPSPAGRTFPVYLYPSEERAPASASPVFRWIAISGGPEVGTAVNGYRNR